MCLDLSSRCSIGGRKKIEDLIGSLRTVDWRRDKHWEGIAGKFTPKGAFSVGGSKETAYAIYDALPDTTSPAFTRFGRRRRPSPSNDGVEMAKRAESSGISLSEADAALVKAMLARGDRQHDIAAWFGVNGGRIGEVATGQRFAWVRPAQGSLPPPGPYPSARQAVEAKQALERPLCALADAETALHAVARSAA